MVGLEGRRHRQAVTHGPALDLDQQVAVLRDKTRAAFGSPDISQFDDPAKMESLVRRFMFQAQAQEQGAGISPAAIALTLLRR